MTWKPQVFIPLENKWHGNALVFATHEEALTNALDLLDRWYIPTKARAVESNDPVNYRYVNHQLVEVKS